MHNCVLVGDCFKVLPSLEADSVDLCVTSPPFWSLRDYGDANSTFGGDPLCEHEWVTESVASRGNRDAGFNERGGNSSGQDKQTKKNSMHAVIGTCSKCGAWRGQLGLEPHPQMFIDHLVDLGRLIRQVLKPMGLFWLNLGDTYCTGAGKSISPGGDIDRGIEKIQPASSPNRMVPLNRAWLQPKQLIMIPSRVACALQDDGWILRSDVIWSKPNHMPESVTDRFTKSYEHFFMFAKQPRYYFNLDAVRENYSPQSIARLSQPTILSQMGGDKQESLHGGDPGNGNRPADILKGLSKRYANTGENNKEPYKGNNPHLFRLSENREAGNINGKNPGDVWEIPTQPFPGSHFAVFPENLVKRIIKCSSPPGGVVLDPFAGSGTTLRVARQLGRKFIGIELNPKYAKMAEERIRGKDFRINLEGITPLIENVIQVDDKDGTVSK